MGRGMSEKMRKTAVMTDSNSGLTVKEAKALGVYMLPMPIYLDDVMYYENETLTREEFFARQANGAVIHTSQPVLGELLDRWNAILKEFDELVYIPMSSGLSGSCAAAMAISEKYEGRVVVVNNQRISVPLAQAVKDARKLVQEGKNALEIREYLMKTRFDSSIYITVDTLEYLKKGGRITPAAAAVGTVLNLKPVLTIQGEQLDAFAKVRGMKAAKKRMITALEDDMNRRFSSIPRGELRLEAAYTCSDEEAFQWKQMLEEHFGQACDMSPLPLSIACHTGPGALGCAFTRQYIG